MIYMEKNNHRDMKLHRFKPKYYLNSNILNIGNWYKKVDIEDSNNYLIHFRKKLRLAQLFLTGLSVLTVLLMILFHVFEFYILESKNMQYIVFVIVLHIFIFSMLVISHFLFKMSEITVLEKELVELDMNLITKK